MGRNRRHDRHFAVTVWSRDCLIPEHQLFDVDYQIGKNCDDCMIYKELMPHDFVKAILHDVWMGLD